MRADIYTIYLVVTYVIQGVLWMALSHYSFICPWPLTLEHVQLLGCSSHMVSDHRRHKQNGHWDEAECLITGCHDDHDDVTATLGVRCDSYHKATWGRPGQVLEHLWWVVVNCFYFASPTLCYTATTHGTYAPDIKSYNNYPFRNQCYL